MTKPDISSVAPFFIVDDCAAALAFYRDQLGLTVSLRETVAIEKVHAREQKAQQERERVLRKKPKLSVVS